MATKIDITGRAVIIDDGYILLTNGNSDESRAYTYLPGGHVEVGESIKDALHREIEEEIGVTKATINKLLGSVECTWHTGDGAFHHEINFIFSVDVPSLSRHHTPVSPETHTSFTWHPLNSLNTANFYPQCLHRDLVVLLQNNVPQVLLTEFTNKVL